MLTPREFGDRIRAIREACGLTVEDVAMELDIPLEAAALIELGKRKVGGLELAKLALLFGCDLEDLLATNTAVTKQMALYRSEVQSSTPPPFAPIKPPVELVHELMSLERLLGVETTASPDGGEPTLQRRVLQLGLEAVRCGKISRAKMVELGGRLNIDRPTIEALVWRAGIDQEEVSALLPDES